MIPVSEIQSAQQILDTVKVERPIPLDKLSEAFQEALERRDQVIFNRLSAIEQALEEQANREKAMQESLEERDRQLMEGLRKLQEKKRPWWRRWFGIR